MNEQTRVELDQLKQRHSQLEQELSALANELKRLESKLHTEVQATPIPPRIVVKNPENTGLETTPTGAPAKVQPEIRIPPRIPSTTEHVSPPVTLPVNPVPAPAARPVAPHPALHLEPRPEKFLKHTCEHCGGHIEFPVSALGQTALCPHCTRSVRLSTSAGEPPVPPPLPA